MFSAGPELARGKTIDGLRWRLSTGPSWLTEDILNYLPATPLKLITAVHSIPTMLTQLLNCPSSVKTAMLQFYLRREWLLAEVTDNTKLFKEFHWKNHQIHGVSCEKCYKMKECLMLQDKREIKCRTFSLDSVHCASKYSSQFNQLKTEASFLDLFSDSTIKVFWKGKSSSKTCCSKELLAIVLILKIVSDWYLGVTYFFETESRNQKQFCWKANERTNL